MNDNTVPTNSTEVARQQAEKLSEANLSAEAEQMLAELEQEHAAWRALDHANARRPWLQRQAGNHIRAGFSKNKGRGQSKTRRRMEKTSRRRNRGK